MDIETETRTEMCVHIDPFIYLNICNYITICCLVARIYCLTVYDPKGYNLPRAPLSIRDFPGQSTGMSCHFLSMVSSRPRDEQPESPI